MTFRLLQYSGPYCRNCKLSFITQRGASAASADARVRCRSRSATLIFQYTLMLNEIYFCMWRGTPPWDANAESAEQLSHGDFPPKTETYH